MRTKQARKLIWGLGLTLLGLRLLGCETAQPVGSGELRFNEDAAADLIVRFSRWDSIYMVRPELRSDGFLTILNRDSIEHQLKTQSSGHNLAVVVLGFRFPTQAEAQFASEWNKILEGCGYRRVVILRTGAGKSTDGLPIVCDSGIAPSHEEAWTVTAPAAFPPTTRADVAHSSSP